MVRRGALALSGDAGIKEIKEWVGAGRYTDYTDLVPAARAPLDFAEISEAYAAHCLSMIDVSAIPRLKVVLDTGNGMAPVCARDILPRLPIETVRMYFEPDGTFPNHPPDPLVEANRREIMERVVAEKADLGIAWDGDADRCFFIDDRGRSCPATS